jgi:hypothetical protein
MDLTLGVLLLGGIPGFVRNPKISPSQDKLKILFPLGGPGLTRALSFPVADKITKGPPDILRLFLLRGQQDDERSAGEKENDPSPFSHNFFPPIIEDYIIYPAGS